MDCSALMLTAEPAAAAKLASDIVRLSSRRDRYMLSPCSATRWLIIIELCEDIHINTVQLTNFEFF